MTLTWIDVRDTPLPDFLMQPAHLETSQDPSATYVAAHGREKKKSPSPSPHGGEGLGCDYIILFIKII